jgi:hypothetical protein
LNESLLQKHLSSGDRRRGHGGHSEYSEATDLVSMMKDDLFAERIAIESYSEIVRWLGNDDRPPVKSSRTF